MFEIPKNLSLSDRFVKVNAGSELKTDFWIADVRFNSSGLFQVIVRSISPKEEMWTAIEIDPGRGLYRRVAEGDSFSELRTQAPKAELSELHEGSWATAIAREACRLQELELQGVWSPRI